MHIWSYYINMGVAEVTILGWLIILLSPQARPLLTRALDDGNFDAIVDPRLGKGYNPNEMRSMIACAAVAVRHSAKRRPRMSQVSEFCSSLIKIRFLWDFFCCELSHPHPLKIVRALEGDVFLDDLNEGVKPGQSSAFGSYGSSDYDALQYNEDLKNFRKVALGSQEYGGSGYSDQTSEYGQIRSASSSEGRRELEMDLEKGSQRGFSGSWWSFPGRCSTVNYSIFFCSPFDFVAILIILTWNIFKDCDDAHRKKKLFSDGCVFAGEIRGD